MIAEDFSQDPLVMRLLMHSEPKLCTLHELRTVYTLSDFYDFLEMIEVTEAIRDDHLKQVRNQK